MKQLLLCIASVLLAGGIAAQTAWKPAGDRIRTPWADKVDPENVRGEYPRPILARTQWMNLNGLWEYAVTEKGCMEPARFEGNILVPFCIESSLSGVQRKITGQQELWYRRSFNVPADWKGRHIRLNFDAVDWQADVYVNDIHIGCHKGGYTGFSFDITPYLNARGSQKLAVRVWDPSDSSYQPCGKQRIKTRTIWYTTVTGIWQTVWLEPVGEAHIARVNPKADIDHRCLEVDVQSAGNTESCLVKAELMDGERKISEARGLATGSLRLSVPDARLWSPEDPFLYTLKLTLTRNGKTVDEVTSYAAMRKISAVRDPETGLMRMQLNNRNYFHFGPLDQGWYPDGLYTAATEEAMLYDIQMTKKMGFNMIRKHVKVEPDRWYYHCDREGLLVWQDMPSGEYYKGGVWEPFMYNGGADQQRSAESAQNYYREWKEIMDFCSPHPCVVVWVPFNEDMGQFETEKVAEWTKAYDPGRLVNPASGGNHRPCGDMIDIHHYPEPAMPLSDPQRVNVLGEFGGIGLPLAGHLWQEDKLKTYVDCKDKKDVTDLYIKYCDLLKPLVERGCSAAVYTQTTDVEGEVNGLMTYDRREVKVEVDRVRKANQEVRSLLDKKK